MTGELHVTTARVRELAGKQDEAATAIAAATTVTAGVSSSMWANHGLVCWLTNIAVANAESARTNACTAMETKSKDLATKLNTAATQYDQTDAQAGEKICKTMPPR